MSPYRIEGPALISFSGGRSLGYEDGRYVETIGLRHDEGHRILKGLANAEKRGRRVAYPLAKAKVTKRDVMAFWASQSFDLELAPHEGNCDLCFLKGVGLRRAIVKDNPSVAGWWAEQERMTGGWWSKRETVADIVEQARSSLGLFDEQLGDDFDAECGLTCGSDDIETTEAA